MMKEAPHDIDLIKEAPHDNDPIATKKAQHQCDCDEGHNLSDEWCESESERRRHKQSENQSIYVLGLSLLM